MSVDPATLRYDRDGLVACICQDAATGDVLMFAWANARGGRAHARDRPRLVLEPLARRAVGEGRDQRQHARDRRRDAPTATATRCSTGCSRAAPPATRAARPAGASAAASRRALARTIEARRDADPSESYVARLLHGPREHAARKVGEEATEVLLAEPGSDEQVGEVADLVFHALRAAGARRPRPARDLRRARPPARGRVAARAGAGRVSSNRPPGAPRPGARARGRPRSGGTWGARDERSPPFAGARTARRSPPRS